MHRNDLNIKNKVHINTKSYINNWNKLALYFRISYIKSILTNVYVYCKNGKKFQNLLCVNNDFNTRSFSDIVKRSYYMQWSCCNFLRKSPKQSKWQQLQIILEHIISSGLENEYFKAHSRGGLATQCNDLVKLLEVV
jgi:hypothetical protein